MKSDRLWEILIIIKPVLMGLLLAGILYACQSDGEYAEDIRQVDTVTAFDSIGPNASGTGEQRLLNSGNLNPGDSFVHVFEEQAELLYFCRYHGGPDGTGMAGTITVSGSGSPSTHRVTVTALEYSDLAVDVGDTVVWINQDDMMHTVETAE